MRQALRLPLLVSGLLWAASWWVIYLEIHRWHHMTPGLRLNPPPTPSGYPPAKPGEFLIGAIVASVVAPVVCAVLLALSWTRRRGSIPPSSRQQRTNLSRRDCSALSPFCRTTYACA